MSKNKRKRTGKVYYDESIKKWIIDKAKHDMTCYELDLINKTKLYTNIVPGTDKLEEDDLSWEEKLDKRQKKIEKLNQKKSDAFWDEYFNDYLKNPDKYKSKLSKTEKDILKFFNKRAMKEGKGKKHKKELKEANKSIFEYYIYEKIKQENDEANKLIESRTGISLDSLGKKKKFDKNPNKTFFKSSGQRDYDETKEEILRSLEAELLDRLNDENMFDRDNIVVEYNDFDTKKAKKKSKKDVDRMII